MELFHYTAMTAEEMANEGQHTGFQMEGEDITPKKDGGVLKVSRRLTDP